MPHNRVRTGFSKFIVIIIVLMGMVPVQGTLVSPMVLAMEPSGDEGDNPEENFVPGPYQLGDFIWNDYDQDGVQDDNEPGIAGVDLVLYVDGVGFVAWTTTDENGFYLFPNLPDGDYGYYKIKIFDYNFQAGKALEGFVVSPRNATDDENDNDFTRNPWYAYAWGTIAGADNLTIDGGFYNPDDENGPNGDLDGDGLKNDEEDVDGNGDWTDDDSDGDGTPDYLDPDDDGDGVYTVYEGADPNGDGNPDDAQDTDGDGTPDYLDPDDDGDEIPTSDENADPNEDGDPEDAQDTDGDGIPDYLDPVDDTEPERESGVVLYFPIIFGNN